MRVRVIKAFEHYSVGYIIPAVPALYADHLIARGLVEKVIDAKPVVTVLPEPVRMASKAVQPVRRKRGRPRKIRKEL